ncbi:MAG TPA: GNAT family N-acetyltransferase [Streptosporangiaceae bacterium]|jgi:RimJ/RimL family protein N-acetyltransferase
MRAFGMTAISTSRLILTRLRPADAGPMTAVLAAEQLYEYIDGSPPTVSELRRRYQRQVDGSGSPAELWLNWIVRLRATREPVGTVQATVIRKETAWSAWVAWVIGMPWQGRGYASEAAAALVGWLREQGASVINAAIHPSHRASQQVASRAGLTLTAEEVEGEQVWRLNAG